MSYWAADVNVRKGECPVHVGSKQFEVVPGWQRRWADEWETKVINFWTDKTEEAREYGFVGFPPPP